MFSPLFLQILIHLSTCLALSIYANGFKTLFDVELIPIHFLNRKMKQLIIDNFTIIRIIIVKLVSKSEYT